jgi:hypothetical protein
LKREEERGRERIERGREIEERGRERKREDRETTPMMTTPPNERGGGKTVILDF